MTTLEPVEFVPDEISILEWYDGVIRGIAESQAKSYLFTLAAWDMASGRKAYVLINLDPATAADMKLLCKWTLGDPPDEEKWHRFSQTYDQYLRNYKGPAYLSNEQPAATRRITITSITTDHLHELLDYDLEKTMDLRAQSLWFGMQ
jgi:hypothetical protein